MFCEICKKKILKRRHLFNLFQVDTHHICEHCFLKYPLKIKRAVLPIDGGEIIWLSMIQTTDLISPIAHMSFYEPLIMSYIKNHSECLLLIYDYMTEELYDLFETLKLGDIYLITLYDKIKQKESHYEI